MNFCIKCGNDVRGSKFCSKCGTPTDLAPQQKKKGIFQKMKEAQAERDRTIRENIAREEREREGAEWMKNFLAQQDLYLQEQENALLQEHRNDTEPFYRMMEDIEKKYSILINIDKNFQSNAADVLLSLCRDNIELKKQLDKKWEEYKYHDIYTYAYQRIAMIYEKQGKYDLAAQACIDAINDGFIRDQTSGGMPARLARMIKRGNLEMTPEMEMALKKELS